MSDEVRLFHEYHAPTGWHSYCTEAQAVFEWQRKEPYIALPAAKHAALMRVVEAARSVVGVMNVGAGHRIDWQDMEVLRELASATRVISTTAHERRGDSAKDGRKEAT